MAVELKNILVQLRMVVRFSYRTARAHFYISSTLFFLLLLYRIFPSLFAFLVSSSPVIICTGMLLGTLLSYGSPNIPQVEEEDEIVVNQKISSLQVEQSDTDDNVVEKDESTNAAVDITKDFAFRKGLNENDDIISVEGNNDDKNEVEGLALNITNDGPFDSSLGSPWQPVDTSKAFSNYDSESDDSESSSDASMTDILPMLDELHPLLDSENSQPVLTSMKSSDLSSNEISHDNESSHDHESSHDRESSHDHESSHDLESEEDNVAKEGDVEKSETKEDTSNEVAVAWNETDQNNVMDLGYSEIERNRRLENLIARRRLRKLQSQKYENEKNLIDLESFYPTSIPSISAPRRNPFDLPQDYDSHLNIPPIPGSAPSVMQPRHNPFDLPYDLSEESGTMSREYLKHHDFISESQKDMLSRRVDNFTSRPSFLGINTFERQLSGESDFKISFASGSDVDSPFKGHHDELNESDLCQERSVLSPINNDDESAEEGGHDIDQLADLNVSSDVTVGVGVEREENEIIEEQSVESDSSSSSSSSESIENISELNAHDELINMDDTLQSNKRLDFAQNHALTIEESSEVALPQKIYEGSSSVENVDLERSGSGHILVQSSVPSVLDESRSREMEINEIKEHNIDVDQNMQSEDTDLNPLASFVQADTPDVASPQNLLETSVPVVDQNSDKLESMGENLQENVPRGGYISDAMGHSIDMDKNIQSGSNYTIEEPSSPASKSETSMSSESSGEESQSHDADINLADNHKNITDESILSASVDSQVEEPNVFVSDIEHDKPTVSEIKFENDIISEHKEELPKGSFNPDTEQENEISNINDEFLAELDVVGDFNISRELKPNQEQTSNQELEQFDVRKINICLANDPEMTVYNPNLRVLDACSIEELDSVFTQDNEAAVLPGIDNSITTMSETVDSGSGASVADTDMIVLEAKSVEDINTALRQQTQSETEQNILDTDEETDVDVKDTYPDYTAKTDMIVLEAKSTDDTNSALEHHILAEEPNKFEVEENDNVDAADMIVLEAKSVEDINTALRRQTEGGIEQSELNIETGIDDSDTYPDNTDTNMIVLEAKSIDDINSAFEHHIVAEKSDSTKVEETSNVDAAAMTVLEAKSVEDTNTALKKQTEGGTEQGNLNVEEKTNAEIRDAYPNNTDTNMIVLEAKSIEDINSALEQHIVSDEPTTLKAEENNNEDTAEMIVLETKSVEDINTALRKQTEGSTVQTILNDDGKTTAAVRDTYPDNSDTNMVVLEAKSIDDINSAIEHHLIAEEPTNLELEENNNAEVADMVVLEAKSVEDITTAFNKQYEDGAEQNILEVEEDTKLDVRDKYHDNKDTDVLVSETKSVEDINAASREHSENIKEHNVLEVEGSKSENKDIELDSELHTVEAKSTDHINLVTDQPDPHIEAGSSGRQKIKLDHIENAEQSDDKFDRVLVADDVSST